MEQINHHFAQNSIIVAQGSVNSIDATVIEAKQCRPKKNQQGDKTQDPEAAWNVKTTADGKRKSTYGFKLHAKTDEDGFIKKMTYTPDNVHDSQEFDHLLGDRRRQVYADSAYANKDNDQKLGKASNRILHRAYRNTPLTAQQKAQHKMYSSVRYVVERTFAYSNCITA